MGTGKLEKAPLQYRYDPLADIMEIEGGKYSGDLFRMFGVGKFAMRQGEKFEFIKNDNGAINIKVFSND